MPERSFLTSRPWTFVPRVKTSPRRLKIPEINTYCKQIQDCKNLFENLHLDSLRHDTPVSSFPRINRSRTTLSPPFLSRSAPATTAYNSQSRHCGLVRTGYGSYRETPKSRLAWQSRVLQNHAEDHIRNETTPTSAIDDDTNEACRKSMDPLQLSDYLRLQGYGSPVMITSSATTNNSQYNLPPGVKSRMLPKNPSKREKIKGRARLDYEMANLRALAFCEQQAPKVFRTASANMRNRDVQFVEDEFREKMQQGDFEKESGSVVITALDKEELFERVNTWIEGVEFALKT